MSRIDKALKRARATAAPPSGSDEGKTEAAESRRPSSEPPPVEMFEAPWPLADVESTEPAPAADARQDRVPAPRPTPAAVEFPARPGRPDVAPPMLTPMALFQGFDPRVAGKLVTDPHARPASVEEYRKLAGTLHHAQLERGDRIVMVVSALAGEGKTLTATNLALTLSESFHRQVLLIDADLRRPALHEIFQVPNLSGLGDALRAEADSRLSLLQISPSLWLLPAGRPDADPMGGLSSERMSQILREAAARFEWVVIDTPPIVLLPDAHLLARMVDTAVLVIQAGQTPYGLAQKAIESVGRERVIGVVLNRVHEGIMDPQHRHYRYYDGYYHGKR